MRLRSVWLYRALLFLLAAASCVAAHAQTDVALSIEGAFSNSTKPGNNDFYRENPAGSGGGLLEVRHIFNSYLGLEASYSFRGANEVFDDLIYGPPGLGCGMSICPPYTDVVSAKAQVFAADWVQSGQIGSFRPFVNLGAGLLRTTPASGQDNATSSTQPAFDYGAGVDWGLTRHVGLRLQYHGDLHRATGFIANDGSPGFVNTAGPALGVFYRF